MAKNKKKLTKQERQLRQLQREQLHRKAKQDLLNSIEAHNFNKGDLVRVGDKVGVIVSYNDNLLNHQWSIGSQALIKVINDFYELANWWGAREEKLLPPKLEEYLQEFIPTTHRVFQSFLKQEELLASIDVPVALIHNKNNSFSVRAKSVMFNKQKSQYLVFNGMFNAYNWLDCGMEQDESVVTTDLSEDTGWFSSDAVDLENSTIHGVFDELLDQAYAVKEKRSRNLGLYKVLYSGEMLGQKGKQQVLVAPCNIQAV